MLDGAKHLDSNLQFAEQSHQDAANERRRDFVGLLADGGYVDLGNAADLLVQLRLKSNGSVQTSDRLPLRKM